MVRPNPTFVAVCSVSPAYGDPMIEHGISGKGEETENLTIKPKVVSMIAFLFLCYLKLLKRSGELESLHTLVTLG